MKTTPSEDNNSTFETSIKQLESLVEKMETSDISLETALNAFEEGIKLTREVQGTIAKAEQKIQMLIEENGTPAARKLHDEED